MKLALAAFLLAGGVAVAGQTLTSAQERTIAAPPPAVQAALEKLRSTTSGKLPTLEGFVTPGLTALESYERPYYQCTVRVSPAPSGGSLVRVSAKITAWRDNPPHSGYEALASNGRLESDLLDRLQDALATSGKPQAAKPSPVPDISAPMPQLPKNSKAVPSSTSASEDSPLAREAAGLEEILRNQAHPTNLIAVKQDQTPVLDSPRADAKVLFLASAEDEFEVLDVNPEWAHVRISGLSRGWLRRSSVEELDANANLPENSTVISRQGSTAGASEEQASVFSVSSEEVGSFPGDWQALKGKTVKIISVQQTPGSGRISSPQEKIRYTESLFRKEQLAAGSEGLVLIFDSEDGGMVAATRAALDRWRAGALSENDFWKQCFRDPAEILGVE